MQSASDQGSSQGNNISCQNWISSNSNSDDDEFAYSNESESIITTSQSPTVVEDQEQSTTAATQTADQDDDPDMKKKKIVPIKPTIVRKHTKNLARKQLMRDKLTSSGSEGEEEDYEEDVMSCADSSSSLIDLINFDPFSDVDDTPMNAVAAVSPKPASWLCSSLPDDVICRVTSFLDVRSLLQVRHGSRHFRDLASRNEAGWENLCRKLWANKIHAPTILPSSSSNSLLPADYFFKAYPASIREAKERQHITMDELCYDPENHTGTIWSFRFKESAGADWTNTDPWHNGLPCRKMVCLKDGSVRQYVPVPPNAVHSHRSSASSNSSGSTSTTTTTTTSASSDTDASMPELISPNFGSLPDTQHQQQQQQGPSNTHNPRRRLPAGRLVQPPFSMSWRFLTSRPMDLPERPLGSYIRFCVGGREVPTYSIRRSPTQNWGFVMESCWGLYASFEMPPKRSPEQQQQAAHRRRLRRTETGARWVEVLENGEEVRANHNYNQHHHASDAERRRSSSSSVSSVQSATSVQQLDDSALMDDAALIITNEIQWREAFLYNVGSRVLPEGPEAVAQFDRAFRGGAP